MSSDDAVSRPAPCFRPFEGGDAPILALWLEKAGLRVPPDLAAGETSRLVDEPSIVLRVAVAEDRVLGFSRLDLAPDRTAEITLIVDPDMRGRGLGRSLLEDVISQGRAHGLRRMFALVEENNVIALGFFVAAGFEHTGVWLPGFVHLSRIVHRSVGAEERPLEIDP